MKKVVLMIFLFIGGAQLAQSQIQGGIKGGINYNSNSFTDVKNDVVFDNAKSKTGFHAGAWLRINLPITNLYLRPELVYTQLSNEVSYKYDPNNVAVAAKTTTYDFQKIDIPVLVGLNFLKVAHVFGGPSFQYILDSDFDIEELKQVNSDGFSVGVQFGAGIELGKLGLDVRWERALSDTEAEFVDSNVGNVNFDTRVNQIILGLSYRF